MCRILAIARCERGGGEAEPSLDITDKISLLQRRLTAAEDLLEATALGLQKTAIEVRACVVRHGEADRSSSIFSKRTCWFQCCNEVETLEQSGHEIESLDRILLPYLWFSVCSEIVINNSM